MWYINGNCVNNHVYLNLNMKYALVLQISECYIHAFFEAFFSSQKSVCGIFLHYLMSVLVYVYLY